MTRSRTYPALVRAIGVGVAAPLLALAAVPAHALGNVPTVEPRLAVSAPVSPSTVGVAGVVLSDAVDVPFPADASVAHTLDEPDADDQSQWRPLSTQDGRLAAPAHTPVRWDPCATITWTFDNPSWDDDQRNARAAVGQISEATGLTFVEIGSKQHAAVHIKLVNFAKVFPVSWRGSFAVTDTTPTKPSPNTWWSYTKATIYLNSWRFHQNDSFKVMLFDGRGIADALHFQTRKHRQHVILHELGHVVGLHHTNWWAPANRTSVMATGVDSLTFTAGDRAGLRSLGRVGGCHPVPAPPVGVLSVPARSANVTTVRMTVPADPARRRTYVWLCTAAVCTAGSTGRSPTAAGMDTWVFPVRCTAAARVLKVTTESIYHTRTTTYSLRPSCPA